MMAFFKEVTIQGERERAQKEIADIKAKQENEQALKEQELSAAQAELWVRQQEAEKQGSKLREAKVKHAFIPWGLSYSISLQASRYNAHWDTSGSDILVMGTDICTLEHNCLVNLIR